MSKNSTQKTLLKHLARAPIYAAKKALAEIPPNEREEAERILAALGLHKPTTPPTAPTEYGTKGEKNV